MQGTNSLQGYLKFLLREEEKINAFRTAVFPKKEITGAIWKLGMYRSELAGLAGENQPERAFLFSRLSFGDWSGAGEDLFSPQQCFGEGTLGWGRGVGLSGQGEAGPTFHRRKLICPHSRY